MKCYKFPDRETSAEAPVGVREYCALHILSLEVLLALTCQPTCWLDNAPSATSLKERISLDIVNGLSHSSELVDMSKRTPPHVNGARPPKIDPYECSWVNLGARTPFVQGGHLLNRMNFVSGSTCVRRSTMPCAASVR